MKIEEVLAAEQAKKLEELTYEEESKDVERCVLMKKRLLQMNH